jgi:predicted nucleic acid-binding protein
MSAAPDNALVVDAAIAAKWHLTDEEHTDKARLILLDFARGKTHLYAPFHIRYEVPFAITAAIMGVNPRLTQAQGKEAIEDFLALDIQTTETEELIQKAYPLVTRYGCTFYDALYLALAQSLVIPLVTADHKLYQRLSHLPDIVWLGDYSPA